MAIYYFLKFRRRRYYLLLHLVALVLESSSMYGKHFRQRFSIIEIKRLCRKELKAVFMSDFVDYPSK